MADPNVMVDDGTGTLRRAQLVAQASGDIVYPENEKSTNVQVRGADGKLHRAQLVAMIGSGGGGDQHNLGYYATVAELEEAHPTAEAGDWAIVAESDTVYIWDDAQQAWVDTDRKGQVESVNGKTGAVVLTASDVGAATTAQGAKADTAVQPGDLATVATSGSYNDLTDKPTVGDGTITITQGGVTKGTFTTNQSGNTTIEVDAGGSALPDQTGQSGKFLTTDGTDASWSAVNTLPSQTGNSGKFLTTNGTNASWSDSIIFNYNYYSIKIAGGSSSSGYNTTSVGWDTQATGAQSCCYGTNCKSKSAASVAIGYFAVVESSAQGAIQLGQGTNNVANTLKIKNYELLSADGTVPADRLVHAINKYSTMPTAASTNEGWIIQFTGTTDSTYTHGHLYECVSDGQSPATYSWTEVQLGGGGSSLPDQTGNSGKFLTTDGTDASWSDKPLVNTATSPGSLTILGVASTTSYHNGMTNVGVGSRVTGNSSTAFGASAIAADRSLSVGNNASTSGAIGGTAVGNNTYSGGWALALGNGARATAAYSCQICVNINGNWSNNESGTFKFGNDVANYKILDRDGTIPTDRFTTTPSAAGNYTATIAVDSQGNVTRSWAQSVSQTVPATPPELTVNGWSNNTQTITVAGVTSTNTVFVAPAPLSSADYAAAGILCTAQNTNSLTFTCTTTPTNAITLSVVILG